MRRRKRFGFRTRSIYYSAVTFQLSRPEHLWLNKSVRLNRGESIEMKSAALFALTLSLLVFANPLYARCSSEGFRFELGQDSNTQRVTDGAPCRFSLLRSRSPIYGTNIMSRPQHGVLSVSGRTTVIYTPAAGYKGQDRFSYQWVGKVGGVTPSAGTVNVSITVQ
jgi:hypothetical protein